VDEIEVIDAKGFLEKPTSFEVCESSLDANHVISKVSQLQAVAALQAAEVCNTDCAWIPVRENGCKDSYQ
jgi:hypothetical protein